VNVALEPTHVSRWGSVLFPSRWDPLTRNGYLLVASSLVTSALGVLFWTLAARRFTAEAVGVSAAAIAALTVLGNISQLNLVNALNRFVPVAGSGTRRLILSSYGVVALTGLVVATVFLVGLRWWAPDLGALRATTLAALLFPVVVIAWTLFIVEDGALVGMRASSYVLGSNAVYALAKIALLLRIPGSASDLAIFWAWSLAVVPVVIVVTWTLWRRLPKPAGHGAEGSTPANTQPVTLGTVASFVAADYSAAMVFTTTQGVLPICVLALVGPSETAHFSLAFTVAYVPYLAGRMMGMSLLTEGARAPHTLDALARRTVQRAAAVVIPMVVVLVASAPVALRVFGAEYAEHAAPLLRLLAVAAVPGLVVGVYAAMLRARNRYRAQVLLAVTMSAAVLGLLVPATSRFGVEAVAWIWLLVHVAAAVVLGLTELRPLWVRATPRREGRLADLHRAVRTAAVAATHTLTAHRVVWSCAVGAGIMWLAGVAGGVEWRQMTDLGLISVLPVTWFVAVALLTIGFVTAVFAPNLSDSWWRSYVALLILAIHATPTVVYGTLRYSWAWKHLGVVDYISRNGQVDPTVSDLSIYHGWPGFFSLNAMLDEAVGDLDLSAVAAWWPVLVNLAIVAALQVIAVAFTKDRRVIAAMCWIFVLTSWVGQDYFSPQALAYVMYLVIVGVVLRTARLRRVPGPATGRSNRSADRSVPVRLPGVVWLLALAIVSIHQLTPVMLVLVSALFVALRYAATLALPLVVGLLTAGWILVFARPLLLRNSDDVALGAVATNVSGSLNDLGTVSPGHALVSVVARTLTVFVAAAAFAGWVHSLRRHRAHGGALLLMAAPLLLIGFTPYGDEILFRVYMFALPGAAFYIASLAVLRRSSLRGAAAVVAVTIVLVPMFLLAHLGNERMYAFTSQEVALTEALYDSAPTGSLIVEGSRNYPAQSRRYDVFTYVPIDREPPATRERIVSDPAAELERWLDNPDYTATFVLLTRSMRIESETLGTMPADGIERIEDALRASPRFIVLASNEDAVVFTLTARHGDTPPVALEPGGMD
jgi:O-antigen/teichoic acid export membrane protein